MKKKIFALLICGALSVSLAGCGSGSEDTETSNSDNAAEEEAEAIDEETEEDTEEESVVNQVEEFRYNGTEDNIAFWNIYMKEDADYDNYYPEDYTEILKACLDNPENKKDDVIFYGIQGFDQDGQIVFSWDDYGTEDEVREVKQFVWRSNQTNPDTYEWELSGAQLQDIYSALDE